MKKILLIDVNFILFIYLLGNIALERLKVIGDNMQDYKKIIENFYPKAG